MCIEKSNDLETVLLNVFYAWFATELTMLYSMQLLLDFQTQFPDLVFPEVPARGDFEMKEVLKSPYFFN